MKLSKSHSDKTATFTQQMANMSQVREYIGVCEVMTDNNVRLLFERLCERSYSHPLSTELEVD